MRFLHLLRVSNVFTVADEDIQTRRPYGDVPRDPGELA